MGKKSDTAKPVTAIAESPASTTKTTTKPAPESAVAVAKPEAASKPEAPPSTPAMDGNGAPPKATAKKSPAKKGVKKTATFSTEDISLRAYFIAEHRQRLGLHGDSHSDWIEAERQLKKESRKKAAAKKKKAVSKKRA